MLRPLIFVALTASPAFADYPEAVQQHILPGYAAFATATQTLADHAAQACDAATLQPDFQAAYDAWMGVQHLKFGPVEVDGLGLAIEYWPDPKGSGAKAQRALLTGDPALLTPDFMAEQSIAARGLVGLERLLYPAADLPADPCPLIRATAADLARVAVEVNTAWVTDYAEVVLTAGDEGNGTYLTRDEARQAVFTQVVTSLEYLRDQRLGRPLGSFDKPHPERAEAVASGRSLRNVRLELAATRAMVESLTPDVPLTMAAFDRAQSLADKLDDPVFAGVVEPQGHLRLEILQQAVEALRDVCLSELGPELNVGVGFNAQDGD